MIDLTPEQHQQLQFESPDETNPNDDLLLVNETMAEDDADDSILVSYQKYGKDRDAAR